MDPTEYIDMDRLNKTRKKRRALEPKPKEREEWEDWPEHLEKGDMLFKYMTENLDSMLDETIFSKDFYIVGGLFALEGYSDKIHERYGDEIQTYVIPWIRKEYEEKRLFDRSLWRVFRDAGWINTTYLGYKKMLKFRNYLFQLIIDVGYYNIHFELAVYDCEHEFDDSLIPGLFGPIPDDMMFPEEVWKRKNGGR
jgi:hypothetical protein